jgi:Holliday junction resolvase RusA-like endonuclease
MILITLNPPKIWTWKAHAGFGKYSFNPMQKEREYVQYHIKSQYDGNLLSCPLRIAYDFYFTVPKSASKKQREKMLNEEIYYTKTPDCTNVQKFFEDCLKGIVIEDDRYVVESTSKKHYANKCSVIIKIYPLE